MNGRRAKLIRKAVKQHPQIVEMGANAYLVDRQRRGKKGIQSRRMPSGEMSEVEVTVELPAFTSPFRQICKQYKKIWRRSSASARSLHKRLERVKPILAESK